MIQHPTFKEFLEKLEGAGIKARETDGELRCRGGDGEPIYYLEGNSRRLAIIQEFPEERVSLQVIRSVCAYFDIGLELFGLDLG